MVAPGGWRVVPIMVELGGRRLRLYRVTLSGRFVCEWSPRWPEDRPHYVAAGPAPLVACTLAAWGHVRYAHLSERPSLYVLPAA